MGIGHRRALSPEPFDPNQFGPSLPDTPPETPETHHVDGPGPPSPFNLTPPPSPGASSTSTMSESRLRRRLGRTSQGATHEPSNACVSSGDEYDYDDNINYHMAAQANTSALDDDFYYGPSATEKTTERTTGLDEGILGQLGKELSQSWKLSRGIDRVIDHSERFKVWESARATSVAPSYLKHNSEQGTPDDYSDTALSEAERTSVSQTQHEHKFDSIRPRRMSEDFSSDVRHDTQDDDESSTIDESSLDDNPISPTSVRRTHKSEKHPRVVPEDSQSGPDLHSLAQNVVSAVDFLLRANERYQRHKQFAQTAEEGVELDNYNDNWNLSNLESGQHHRPLSRNLRRKPQSPKSSTIDPQSITFFDANSIFTSMYAPHPTQIPRGTDTQTTPITVKTSTSRPPLSKRTCYYLITALAAGLVSSLILALWWARSAGDISAGFTVGSYVVAVVALVIAAAGVFHAPGCRCWKGVA
ncbi:hypothetical protein GGR57DRAFT_352838 [Xylariaceae sp. FL1272]|nr:hypothetical protein GGR57DRAFT_352838 [Xylariaceae sp. FL1272]